MMRVWVYFLILGAYRSPFLKVTYEQRHERNEGVSLLWKECPREKESKCKGPEA